MAGHFHRRMFQPRHDDEGKDPDELDWSLPPAEYGEDEKPLEEMLESYYKELSSTLEQFTLDSHAKLEQNGTDDDDDDDGCFVEMQRVSMSIDEFKEDEKMTDPIQTSLAGTCQTTALPDVEALERDLQAVAQTWKQLLHKRTNQDLHYAVIREICENEGLQLSPFMLVRLAGLSKSEFQSMILTGASRRLHNDYRVLINWLYEQLESQEKDHEKVRAEYSTKISDIQQSMAEAEDRKRRELELALKNKRDHLLALLSTRNSQHP